MGSSRQRANWHLTVVKRLRNVLGLITAFTVDRRDVRAEDPEGRQELFRGCVGLKGIVVVDTPPPSTTSPDEDDDEDDGEYYGEDYYDDDDEDY